jgi:GNAT superfamily N-acetyltransferase
VTAPAVISDYVPGAIGWVVAEHGRYYAREWNLPAAFECRVAAELAALYDRHDERDGFWVARSGTELAGAIAIDGAGDAQWARLRFFILSDAHRGKGVGNALMRAAMDFCRRAGHRNLYLTTFAGLDAARHLYEKFGFRLVSEHADSTWGQPLLEQRFEQALH